MKLFTIITVLALGFMHQSFANQWDYSNKEESMGRGYNEVASIQSENTFELQAPYMGSQHATLVLRRLYNTDNELVILIEKGQFICGVTGCSITARIDNNESFSIPVAIPHDGSTNMLIGSLNVTTKRSILAGKKLLIETTIYQNGEHIFEFNINKSPFHGKNGYPLSELKTFQSEKKEMPALKDHPMKVDLDAGNFKICKQVISDKHNDEVLIINKDNKTNFITTSYKEYMATKQECKKGTPKIFIEFYEYQ
ncbi:hypothetical protein [uncultured Tolumonas sp.]|uniref:hypothetical protein n=1 Tax=uncultured Tolumonas sp. TaxID=263765 RepID=UPI002A0A236F|nr:hypothetical protein [uncultured Tolumonas sp.]